MVSISQTVGTLAKAVTFSALDKFDTLNSLVNRITGGKVNRDSLATSVFHRLVDLGVDYMKPTAPDGDEAPGGTKQQTLKQMEEQGQFEADRELHERFGLGKNALINNDIATMKQSVSTLAKKVLGDYIGTGNDGVLGKMRVAADSLTDFTVDKFAESYVGDHAGEKLLATMVKKHGWDSLKSKLNDITGGGIAGKLISKFSVNLLQRAIVDKPEFNMQGNAEYDLAADLMHTYLSGKDDYDTRLRDYAPTLMSIKDITVRTMGTVDSLREGIDNLSENVFGIKPGVVLADSIFEEELKQLPKPITVNTHTIPRDFAPSVVLDQLRRDRFSTEGLAPLAQKLAPQLDDLEPGHREQLQQTISLLSPQQRAPFEERSDIGMAYTTTGVLSHIETQSHRFGTTSEHDINDTVQALTRAPAQTVELGGYRISAAFASQIKELNLNLSGESVTYRDSAIEGGKALFNTVVGWLHASNTEPDWTDSTLLKQIYNTCSHDINLMQEVSRYLDADLALSAVGDTALRGLRGPDPDVLIMGEKQIKLTPNQQPDVRFDVHNDGEFVRVSIDVHYRVESYGTANDMRKPHGAKESVVTASASILIRPGDGDTPPATVFHPMGSLASVFNAISFDRKTGELLETA